MRQNLLQSPGALLAAALSLSVSAPLFAQQTTLPTVVQIEGAAEVLDRLRTIENLLEQMRVSQWEYRFVQRNVLNDLSQQIQNLGRDGWELVNVTVEEGYIFKRQIARR